MRPNHQARIRWLLVAAVLASIALAAEPAQAQPLNCDALENIDFADLNCNGIVRSAETDGLFPNNPRDCLSIERYPSCVQTDDAGISQRCDDFQDSNLADGLGATCNQAAPRGMALDTDGDCIGDHPSLPLVCDNCPNTFNPGQEDTDGDGVGDACDNCPMTSNPRNSQGLQPDTDMDNVGDACDNCRLEANPLQEDNDDDLLGNACDNCPDDANIDQLDGDDDDVGDICDNCPELQNTDQADEDTDRVGDLCDNCIAIANTDQANDDSDSMGNACDNCPSDTNEDQADSDTDKAGDVCDNCPNIANEDQADGDSDVVGDICDNCPTVANADQEESPLANAQGEHFGIACEPGAQGGAGCSSYDGGSEPWLPIVLLSFALTGLFVRRRRSS